MRACFVPNHNCQERLIKAIDNAQSEILVMCYAFTNSKVGEALVSASKRGVSVTIVTDKTQREHKKSQISHFVHSSIPVHSDDKVAIAHNKVMIIDEKLTITGSYNYSEAAQHRNAENLLFVESKELVEQYKRYWQDRRDASIKLSPKPLDKAVHKEVKPLKKERIP